MEIKIAICLLLLGFNIMVFTVLVAGLSAASTISVILAVIGIIAQGMTNSYLIRKVLIPWFKGK